MKLKKIIIHNIASIEDATIDFEHGPLSQDSRFLICGPTGTGKTTLLDCICLALYCTTPRLKSATRESYSDPNESYANNNREEVSIDDSRMLMRRGALDAYVHLYFTDKEDVDLKAVWSCRRARNKATGTIQPYEWFLCDDRDVVVAQRQTSMRAVIPQRIGLTFEQFCRTTLLAQGDFTKFLKSGESEKAEILEKLTGTEIYSEISRRIHQLFGQKESACNEIRSRLGGVQLLSEERTAEICQQQEALNLQRSELVQKEQQWTAVVAWWKQLDEALNDWKVAQEKEAAIVKETETETFAASQQLLKDWDRTAKQREQLRSRNEQQEKLRTIKEEELKLQAGFEVLLGGKTFLQKQIQTYVTNIEKARAFLEKESVNIPIYQEVNAISALLQSEISYRKELEQSTLRIKELNNTLERLQTEQKSLQAALQESQDEEKAKESTYRLELQKLHDFNYDQLLQHQTQLRTYLDKLVAYEHLLDQYDQYQQNSQKAKSEVASEQQLFSACEHKVNQAKLQIQVLTSSQETQELIYEKQKCACEDLMKEYRHHLAPGDCCPLCGQEITALPTDEHFHSLLQPVEEQLDKLKKQLTEVKDFYNSEMALMESHRKLVAKAQQEWVSAQNDEAKTEKELQLGELGKIYSQVENRREVLLSDKKSKEDELQQLNEQLRAVGVQQKKVDLLRKEFDFLMKQVQQAEKSVTDGEKKLADVKANLDSENRHHQSENEHLEETLQRLNEKVSAERRAAEGVDFLSRLKSAADKYNRGVEAERNWSQQLTVFNGHLEQVLQAETAILESKQSWKVVAAKSSESIADLPQRWSKLATSVALNVSARLSVEEEFEKLDRALQHYFSGSEAVDEPRLLFLLQQSSETVEQERNQMQQLHEEIIRSRELCNKAKSDYEQRQKVRPEMEKDMTLVNAEQQWALQKEALSRCDQQLGELRQMLDQDVKNHQRFATIQQELQAAEAESNRWGRLHELFGSADGKKFRNIAQSYVLTQLLINANQYLRQFTDRYEMVCQPGSLTILLCDNEAGGITRPTTTISGGEGFLISLSLALGLSSLSRASISMDTLFIDEGFGTLDSTYLSAVMDALERLHQMGGKRVGIISHVESLKDRVTTQIQVSRVNTTLSKVEVVSLL